MVFNPTDRYDFIWFGIKKLAYVVGHPD